MDNLLQRSGSRLLYLTAELFEEGMIEDSHKRLLKCKPPARSAHPFCSENFAQRHQPARGRGGNTGLRRAQGLAARLQPPSSNAGRARSTGKAKQLRVSQHQEAPTASGYKLDGLG